MTPFTLGKRPALDGLRGLAIALVVLVHYTGAVPALRSYVKGGFIGVEVFFVLSGFLITTVVLSEAARKGSVDLKGFYRRRGFRLVPALYLMVAVVVAIGALRPIERFGSVEDQFIVGAAALAYVMNLLTSALPDPLPIWSQPLWSLCVEVHFYLLWPPLLVFVAKRRASLLPWLAGAVIVGSIAFRVVVFGVAGTPYQTILTPARFDGLAMGALVAIALRNGWRPSPRLRGIGVAGLGVLALMTVVGRTSAAWMVIGGYTLVNVSTAAILVDALDSTTLAARVLRFSPLRYLGEWSYALYLWHIPVYFILDTQLDSSLVLVPTAVVTSVVVAWASSTFFEMPLRRYGGRRRRLEESAADPQVAWQET